MREGVSVGVGNPCSLMNELVSNAMPNSQALTSNLTACRVLREYSGDNYGASSGGNLGIAGRNMLVVFKDAVLQLSCWVNEAMVRLGPTNVVLDVALLAYTLESLRAKSATDGLFHLAVS